jgi:hypothetical protein
MKHRENTEEKQGNPVPCSFGVQSVAEFYLINRINKVRSVTTEIGAVWDSAEESLINYQ